MKNIFMVSLKLFAEYVLLFFITLFIGAILNGTYLFNIRLIYIPDTGLVLIPLVIILIKYYCSIFAK